MILFITNNASEIIKITHEREKDVDKLASATLSILTKYQCIWLCIPMYFITVIFLKLIGF